LELRSISKLWWKKISDRNKGKIHPKETEDALRKKIERDPKSVLTLHSLGTFLSSQNRAKEAEEAFRNALEIDPNDAKIWDDLGILLKKQNRI